MWNLIVNYYKLLTIRNFLQHNQKFVNWALDASDPTLIKGSPGTGKSTVALYRVRALIAHLKKNGLAKPKIFFTTYTNALITFSQQLLERGNGFRGIIANLLQEPKLEDKVEAKLTLNSCL